MEMRKKKRGLGKWLATVCLVLSMTMGIVSVAGATWELKDYFYVSVAMEISATMQSAPQERPVVIERSGIEIEDWGQAVSAGSTVSASLRRRSGVSSSVAAPSVTYSWVLTKGTKTETRTGSTIYVPTEYAGGSMQVTATVTGNSSMWSNTPVTSVVSIS